MPTADLTANVSGETAANSALRSDIRMLGELLGETIVQPHDQELLDKVEQIKAATRGEFDRVAQELSATDLETAIGLDRAFSTYFNLANIAEQVHRRSQKIQVSYLRLAQDEHEKPSNRDKHRVT